jgi:GAF domain-containing protein
VGENLKDLSQRLDVALKTIETLEASRSDNAFAEALRLALLTASTSGVIGSSSTHGAALDQVVETAADVLDAEAASLFLLDEDTEELVFVVALGAKADEVKQFRVPVGHGIAGYVASTGQPIAIADASQDPRFAREIGEAIDYVPSTILCVPMYLGDRLIGVLELMDKAHGAHFSASDMAVLGRFANLAAITVDETRLTHDIRGLFRSLLVESAQGVSTVEAARRFADRSAEHEENKDIIRMAALILEISRRGDEGTVLALDVLNSLANYVSGSAPSAFMQAGTYRA